MFFLLPLTLPVVGIAAITKFYLSGENLKKYDRNNPVTFKTNPNSAGHKAVKDYLIENFIKPAQSNDSDRNKLSAKRARFEQTGLTRDFGVTFKDDSVVINDEHTMSGEWTLANGADPDRRILYIHGGAFTVGSPISHRAITSNLSKKTGCAVFACDYRLMPENPRMAGITDARAAYDWVRENGPNGPATVKALAYGGDSAGGNLTLMLSNWIRDTGREAPNAVFALSPATDSTATSPSIRENFETDFMLKPLVGPMLKIPRHLLLWFSWKANGISPASPLVSPVFAPLNDLPPTLVHVSAHELLYDDARRYVNKAKDAGSPVSLQSWDHVCHVWHIFDEMLPESHQALDEIAAFLAKNGVKGQTAMAASESSPDL